MGSGPYPVAFEFRPPAAPAPTAGERIANRLALGLLQRAGAVGTLAGVVGGVVAIYSLLQLGATVAATTSSSSGSYQFSIGAGTLELGLLLLVLGGVLQLAGMAWYRAAFLTLREEDVDFEGPASRIGWGLLGIPPFLLFYALVAVSAVSLANCANALPAGADPQVSCANQVAVLQTWLLLAVIFALPTGYGLTGVLRGVWRLESHFGSSLFKVAAVLLFLAFVPFAAAMGSLIVWTRSRQLSAPTRAASGPA